MFRNTFNIFINCLRHPSIMYFFILPVYLPVRTLAEYLVQYQHAFPSVAERLYFFISNVVIDAFVCIIIFFVVDRITRFFNQKNEYDAISKITFLSPILLLVTTYLLLDQNIIVEVKFTVMGIHFYLLKFLTN